MNSLNKEAIKQLAAANEYPCVSIYLPLEQEADKHDKNRIRLKNQLAAAAEQLSEQGLAGDEVADLLQPAADMIAHGRFTLNLELNEGLAIFLAPETTEIYTLPVSFAEQALVANHFYLTPLLPLLQENGRFYILALSQNEIRFLQATAHSIEAVMLDDDIPASLDDALKWEDPETQSQWHTGASPQAGRRRQAIFHGHGVTNEETQKERIQEYFRQVAAGIDDLLKEKKAPLVLAGVDYLLPIYQKVSGYPHLAEGTVSGNPEQLSRQILREKAWAVVAPQFDEARQEALARFADQAGSEMGTDVVEEVIAAAHYGQVDTLFMAENGRYWGSFDETQAAVQSGSRDDGESQELLERTAVNTLLHGGTVYTMPRADMPGEATAAALLRSPLSVSA
jgi:hypothetical protein